MARVNLRPAARIVLSGDTGELPAELEYEELATTDPDRVEEHLAFPDGEDRWALWNFEVPAAYNGTGNITFRVHGKAAASSGTARLVCRGVSIANGESASTDWGALQNWAFTVTSSTNLHILTNAIAPANLGSPQAGEDFTVLFGRDGDGTSGTDDLTQTLYVKNLVLDFPE